MWSGHGRDSTMDSRVFGELQECIARFRAALQRGERPPVEDYATADESHRAIFLSELVHEELEHRLRAGEGVSVESYLDRFRRAPVGPAVCPGAG